MAIKIIDRYCGSIPNMSFRVANFVRSKLKGVIDMFVEVSFVVPALAGIQQDRFRLKPVLRTFPARLVQPTLKSTASKRWLSVCHRLNDNAVTRYFDDFDFCSFVNHSTIANHIQQAPIDHRFTGWCKIRN